MVQNIDGVTNKDGRKRLGTDLGDHRGMHTHVGAGWASEKRVWEARVRSTSRSNLIYILPTIERLNEPEECKRKEEDR